MQNTFCKWRGKLFLLYLPNSTSTLINDQFRRHKEGQEYKQYQNEVANGVSRNLAWQLLTAVSSLTLLFPSEWKDVGASFAALALHLENRWFSSPARCFYSAAIKSKFCSLPCTEIPGCRFTAVCPAVVPLVTLPSNSSRADLQNLTHLPVWSDRLQRSLDNSPSCPQCEPLWPRQVPSNMIFTKAMKRLNCHGRAFLSLGCCLVLAKFGNKKKNGVSFPSLYFSNNLDFYLWMCMEWLCPSCMTAPLQGEADRKEKALERTCVKSLRKPFFTEKQCWFGLFKI